MNLLDENIANQAWQTLREWRVRVRKIGKDIGRRGMSDEDIFPFLHRLKTVTFFTLDQDYYSRRLCHASYCLVFLDVEEHAAAETIRRFLRHPTFKSWAQRKGKVIRITAKDLRVWRPHAEKPDRIPWKRPPDSGVPQP